LSSSKKGEIGTFYSFSGAKKEGFLPKELLRPDEDACFQGNYVGKGIGKLEDVFFPIELQIYREDSEENDFSGEVSLEFLNPLGSEELFLRLSEGRTLPEKNLGEYFETRLGRAVRGKVSKTADFFWEIGYGNGEPVSITTNFSGVSPGQVPHLVTSLLDEYTGIVGDVSDALGVAPKSRTINIVFKKVDRFARSSSEPKDAGAEESFGALSATGAIAQKKDGPRKWKTSSQIHPHLPFEAIALSGLSEEIDETYPRDETFYIGPVLEAEYSLSRANSPIISVSNTSGWRDVPVKKISLVGRPSAGGYSIDARFELSKSLDEYYVHRLRDRMDDCGIRYSEAGREFSLDGYLAPSKEKAKDELFRAAVDMKTALSALFPQEEGRFWFVPVGIPLDGGNLGKEIESVLSGRADYVWNIRRAGKGK